MTRLIALAVLLPLAAHAQASGGPAGNGNVYGHLSHQPAQTGVKQREHAAGIAPPHAAAKRQDETLQTLDKQILRRNGASPASAGAVGPKG